MTPRLLVIGDVAWDIFIRPERDLVRGSDVLGTVDVMPGGAAANVAVWARRLGASVRLVCKLGDDTLGTLMAAHLRAEGVGSHIITVPGGLTTRVGILVGPDGEHSFVMDHTKVLLFGAADAPASLLDGVDAVFFNGYDIFLAGSTDFLSPLLDRGSPPRHPGRLRSVVVHADRSLRGGPAAGGRRPAGPADRQRRRGALAGHDVDAGGPREAGGREARADGASAHRGRESWSAGPHPIAVVDTTGAGDGFDAAFLVEWLQTPGRRPRARARQPAGRPRRRATWAPNRDARETCAY